jgi:hypothetical protein
MAPSRDSDAVRAAVPVVASLPACPLLSAMSCSPAGITW